MNEPRKMILRRIPIYELMSILDHLYNTGADFVDIVGMSHVDVGTQDEIMIAVKDEYISSYRPEDDSNVEEINSENKMEGVANVVEAPPAQKIKKLTEEVLLNLL